MRSNWIAAMAHYHAKDYSVAHEIIVKANSLKQEGLSVITRSELLMMQNLCLEKQGLYQEALDHLKESESKIVDKLGVSVRRAELMTLLGSQDKTSAIKAWLDLLDDEPENYRYLLQVYK